MNIIKVYQKTAHGTRLLDQGFFDSCTAVKNGDVTIYHDSNEPYEDYKFYQPTAENGLYWIEYGERSDDTYGKVFDSRTGQQWEEKEYPLPPWFSNPYATSIPEGPEYSMSKDGTVVYR